MTGGISLDELQLAARNHAMPLEALHSAVSTLIATPSVRLVAETSARHAVAMPESYRIDDFRDARKRQSRSPKQAGWPPG